MRSLWVNNFYLLLLFALGWIFQYLGFISPTETNLIAIFFAFVAFLYYRFNFPLVFFIGSCAGFLFLLSSFFWSQYTSGIWVYFYYILAMYVGLVYGWILQRNYKEFIIKYFRFFCVFQAVLTSIQSLFPEQWVAFSNVQIGVEDAVSGTMFLQSDATLVYLLSMTYFVVGKLFFSLKDRLLIAGLIAVVVLNANSIAGAFFYGVTVCFVIFSGLIKYYRLSLFIGAGHLVLAALLIFMLLDYDIYGEFFDSVYLAYVSRMNESGAGRFAPIGHVLFEELDWFGYGPLTYYNPITKEWLYNSGMSTYYSIYIDYGLIGVGSVFLPFLGAVFYCCRFSYGSIYLALAFLLFSLFNFVMTDLAFLTTFGFCVAMLSKERKQGDIVTRR